MRRILDLDRRMGHRIHDRLLGRIRHPAIDRVGRAATLGGLAALAALALALAAPDGHDAVTSAQAAPTPRPLDILGHVGGAPCDVAVSGRHAFVATGYALDVYDLSDLGEPVRVGRLLRRGVTPGGGGDRPQQLHVQGARGLLVDRNMVRILDLSQPAAPVEEGVFRWPDGAILDAVSNGTHMYVATRQMDVGIAVVDITNPAAPTIVGYTRDGDYTRLALAAGCLYAIAERSASPQAERGLRVYDVAAPAAPVALAWYEGITAPNDLAVAGSRLYTALNGGVRILGIGDPTDVRRLGSIATGDPVEAVASTGARLFLVHGGVLEAYDASDAAAPIALGSLRVAVPNAGEAGVAASTGGDFVLTTHRHHGTTVVAVTDSGAVSPAAVLVEEPTGRVDRVAAGDRRAFALASGRLVEVDTADPAHPVVVAVREPGTNRRYTHVGVHGETLCLLTEEDQALELEVLDVSVRGAPRRQSALPLGPGWAADLAVHGTLAFVGLTHTDGAVPATYDWHVRVVDLSDPASAHLVGDLPLARNWSVDYGQPALHLMDTRMLVGHYGSLTVADFSDPRHPGALGLLEPGFSIYVRAVVGTGHRAYLAYDSSRVGDLDNLAVVDLSDPTRPAIVANRAARYQPLNLALGADYLYAGSREGVQMLARASSPELAPRASLSLPAWARAIALEHGLAYVADDDAGLFVLHTGDAGLPAVVPPPLPAVTTPSSLPPTATASASSTATPAVSPTGTVGTQVASDTPPAPSATPTTRPDDCVCRALQRRVPPVVIADAVANPEQYQGWLRPRNPNAPVGPANPLRTCLSLQRLTVPYHPLWNPVVWRAGCH